MSQLEFFILAAFVTIAGLVSVVWTTQRNLKFLYRRTRYIAVVFLLILGASIFLQPSSWLIIDLAVLLGAIGGAILIGHSLGNSRSVVVFLVVAAIFDILSINLGLSRAIIENYQEGSSNLLLYLALVIPIGSRLVPVVGVSDLLVGGAAASALIRNGFKPILVVGGISIGFIAALGYGLWGRGAPGLPFIAIAVAFLVWRGSVNSSHTDNEVSSS